MVDKKRLTNFVIVDIITKEFVNSKQISSLKTEDHVWTGMLCGIFPIKGIQFIALESSIGEIRLHNMDVHNIMAINTMYTDINDETVDDVMYYSQFPVDQASALEFVKGIKTEFETKGLGKKIPGIIDSTLFERLPVIFNGGKRHMTSELTQYLQDGYIDTNKGPQKVSGGKRSITSSSPSATTTNKSTATKGYWEQDKETITFIRKGALPSQKTMDKMRLKAAAVWEAHFITEGAANA